MIKVEKDFSNIPTILKSDNRKEAFDENISLGCYSDSKNRYKARSVQKKLNEIYNLKCAYCEQKLLDAPKHIEHYRPKNTYYWLAYSWDNLLLSCGSCNSTKSDNFKIKNDRVVYGNENFEDIHELGDSYDRSEVPLIINPEKDDVLELIEYTKNGIVFSNNERVNHTIKNACKLNRDELVQKRLPILTDFINQINKHYELFKKHGDITRFYPDIESFRNKVSKEYEFYSFRYYIIKNLELFFENENIQKLLQISLSKI
jgi:uncharacterized protein (TIGR02646 family)